MGFLLGCIILWLTYCPVESGQSVILEQFCKILQSSQSDIVSTSLKILTLKDIHFNPTCFSHQVETRSEPKCETDELILVLDYIVFNTSKGLIELGKCSWVFYEKPGHHNFPLRRLQHRFNSKVYLLDTSVAKKTTIRDFYLLKGTLQSHIVEIWDEAGLKWQNLPIFQRRRNLRGVHFKIALAEFIPYQVIPNGRVENMSGLTVDIILDLAAHLNFTFEIINNEVDLYGNQLENGSFNGMMGRIATGEVDFGLGFASMTEERQTVIDFVPFYISSDNALFVWKTGAAISKSSFFGMFDNSLWVSLIVLVLAIFGASLLIFWINPRVEEASWDSLFHIPAALLNQGSPFFPQSLSRRILMLTCLLFGWLAMVVLSARLVSHLT